MIKNVFGDTCGSTFLNLPLGILIGNRAFKITKCANEGRQSAPDAVVAVADSLYCDVHASFIVLNICHDFFVL